MTNKKKLPKKFEATEHGYVTLPYTENQFKEFIVGLLGKPQTIAKEFYGQFEVELDGIKNIYHKINQRITQQNKAYLIQFNSTIVYDDDSSVLLNSFESFCTYNEIKPVVVTSVHMQWVYMVEFMDKDIPEKQEISLSIAQSGYAASNYDNNIKMYHWQKGLGYINYNIKHTARTWGADLEALLTNHFKSIIKNDSKFKKFFRSFKEDAFSSLGLLFFLLTSIIGSFIGSYLYSDKIKLEIKNALDEISSKGTDIVNNKIDFIINNIAEGNWSQFYFSSFIFILLSMFLGVMAGLIVEQYLIRYEPSYILLTKESYNFRNRMIKKVNKGWGKFFISLAIGVLSSLIASYIFIKVTQL